MFNKAEFEEILINNEVYGEILQQNKMDIDMLMKLQTFVKEDMLSKMNDIKPMDENENRVNQAIFILFAQAIKSYKASMLLATNGYFTETNIILRNIVEVIFNIKYILEDSNKKVKRADNYIEKNNNWTNDTVKNRALKSLDKPLYEVYRILCNYSHANYMGTAQNYKGDFISIEPSLEKIGDALVFANSLYFYLVKFVCEYYEIDYSLIRNIEKTEKFKGFIELYDSEKSVLDFFLNIFREIGAKEEEIELITKQFKEFTIKDKKNNNSKKKRKRKKR